MKLSIITLSLVLALLPGCYKCPGNSGYSPQCGKTVK